MPKYKFEYYSVTGNLLGEQTAEFGGILAAEQQLAMKMKNITHKIQSNDKDGNITLDIIATNHIAKVKVTEYK